MRNRSLRTLLALVVSVSPNNYQCSFVTSLKLSVGSIYTTNKRTRTGTAFHRYQISPTTTSPNNIELIRRRDNRHHLTTMLAEPKCSTNANTQKSSKRKKIKRFFSHMLSRKQNSQRFVVGGNNIVDYSSKSSTAYSAFDTIPEVQQNLTTINTVTTTTSNPGNSSSFIIKGFEKLSPETLLSTIHNATTSISIVLEDSAILPSYTNTAPFSKRKFSTFMNKKQPRVMQKQNGAVEKLKSDTDESINSSSIPDLDKNLKKHSRKSSSSDESVGGTFISRIPQKHMQNLLHELINNRTIVPTQNLTIQCLPRGNILGNLIFQGLLECNTKIGFKSKTEFKNIRFSSGSLEFIEMGLNIWTFRTPSPTTATKKGSSEQSQNARSSSSSPLPRYRNQFDVNMNQFVFTEDDLSQSSCIINGLQRLFLRILKKRGFEASIVRIKSMRILPNNKVSCIGETTIAALGVIQFEVRTSIGTTCRGHVITFPGLEILVPSLALFYEPKVSLDVGHNAKLNKVHIDGRNKRLTASASTTITPLHTIKLNPKYKQTMNSYSASSHFDVGRWLTRIGNFTK